MRELKFVRDQDTDKTAQLCLLAWAHDLPRISRDSDSFHQIVRTGASAWRILTRMQVEVSLRDRFFMLT